MKQRFINIMMLVTLMAFAVSAKAQTEYKPVKIKKSSVSNNFTSYKPVTITKDSLGSFSSRISLSTNFIDWALFTPNIGFEIDLGNQEMIGAQSLYFNFKYKPTAGFKANNLQKDSVSLISKADLGTLTPFNYWSGRLEYRWHFRFNEHPGQRRGLLKPALGLYSLFTKREYRSEAMARAMESSQIKRPEMIPGRHYVGIFAEYMNYTLNTKLDIIDKNSIKNGYALMGGFTLGYEFPAFYNHGHYWQFHIGANVGAIYTPYDKYLVNKTDGTVEFSSSEKKVLPMVTELKFGMTFRKENISHKYWRASNRIEMENIAENREMQALIDSITENYSFQTKIFITVPSSDDDMAIKTPLTKKDVVKAIRQQTKMPLAEANFINDTIFPIKRLDDYVMTYRFNKAVNKYSDELEEYTDVVFRFRVELEGRNEAEKLKQTLVDALQKYRNEKGIPVLYANSKPRSGDRNEIEGYVPWPEVMTLFSRIWGKTVTMRQFKGVSLRVGNGVIRPVDERGINRRSRYTISMQFHPQVEFNYDTDPVLSQFEVQFRGEASGLSNYNKINGHRLTFERSYKGGDTFEPEITVDDIAAALKRDGIEVETENIEVASGLNKFGQRYTASVYLQAGYVANVSFVVNDKGGLDKAKSDFNNKLNPWIQSRKWPEVVIKGVPQDPKNVDIPTEDVLSAFVKASGYDFKDYQFTDYCVDNEYVKMQDGRYRAYAKFQLHRELTTVPKVPYYIRFDNSEAERLAREKAEAERKARLEREKFIADSIAAVKAEAERLAKIEADRIAREKFVADSIATAKAEAERLAREKEEAERLARLEREKFVADSLAMVKAEQERIAREEAERLAAEQAEAERVAAAKAEAERLAREKAEAERLAAEKAEQERIAAALAEAERLAAEKAEQERLAKAEADRLAREEAAKAEAERLAAEKAEQERIARAEAERIANELAAEAAEKARLEAEEKAKLEAEANNKQEEEKPKREVKPGQKVGIIVQKSEAPPKPQPKVSVNTQTVEEATNDMETKVRPWIQKGKKAEIIFRGDPVDPKTLNITKDKIITAFRKASDYVFKEYHFVDYCVGNNYVLLPDGRYRAMVKIKMHDELDPIEIPYFIRFAN